MNRLLLALIIMLGMGYSFAEEDPPWIMQPSTKICINHACLGMSVDQLPKQEVWTSPDMYREMFPEVSRNYYVALSKLQSWCPYTIGRKFVESEKISGKLGEDYIVLRAIAMPKTKASSHSNFAVVKVEFEGPITREEFIDLPNSLMKAYPTLSPSYIGEGSQKAFTALSNSDVTLSIQPYVPLNPAYVSSQYSRVLKIMALWRVDGSRIPDYYTKLQNQSGCEWPKDLRTNALKALNN